MMKAVLTIGLLALVSGSTDTFHFTQCECPNFEFNSAQKSNFPNPLVISGNSALFDCPGNGSFPDESGLILDVSDADSSLTTSGVNTNLFGEIVEGTKKGWNAAFRISFVPEAAEFNLMEIFNNGRSVYNIPISIQSFIQNIRTSENSGIGLDIPYVLGEEVTLDVMVGDVFSTSIDGGETTIDLSFVCASINNENVNCKAGTAPIIVDLDSASNIELLKSTAGSRPLQVSVLSAEFNNDGATDGISVNNLQEFLVELARRSTQIIEQLPKTISLPIPKEKTSLSTNEDENLSGNLFSFLTGGTLAATDLIFGIETKPINGIISTDDLPEFVYSPNKDFNGDDSFTLSYGIVSPFECINTVEKSISVAPEPDPPVAKDLTLEVFANIPALISEEIATDADEEDGKMDGTVTFGNTLPGVISASCDSTDSITEATVTDGSVSFCYTPDDSMGTGGLAILRFTVTDEDGNTDSGTITFNGNDPVVLAAKSPFQVLNEDGIITFFLGQNRYGQRLPGTEDIPINIRVTRLPGSGGVLKDLKDDAVNLDSNSEFLDSDSLTFIPNPQVFNAAVDGSPFDASGELLGNCNRRVAINEIPGYCPISFEYKIFRGEFESAAQQAFFLVNAIDDGKPTITVRGFNEDTVLVSQSSNELGVPSLSDVKISSDDGGNAFQLTMEIQSTNGAQFKLKDPQNAKGIVVSRGANAGEQIDDCKEDFCTLVEVTATPVQLERMASLLEINLPLTALDPSMTLTVSDLKNLGSDQISINFSFVKNESKSLNIGIVGGAAGAGVLLVVAVIVGFVAFRRQREKERSSEIMEVDTKKYLDLETRSPRNEVTPTAPNENHDRSEQELPDTWERLVDHKRVKEYFYNRKRNAIAWYKEEKDDPNYGSTYDEEATIEEDLPLRFEVHIDRETDQRFILNIETGRIHWNNPFK